MPYYLFTFRPQVTEQDLFENFITILKPELAKLDKYAYSIEEDNTLQKHIHVIAEHPTAKDLSAFKQMFNKKIFKDFKSSLRTKQTNDKGFDDRKVTEAPEDFLKTLGYVMKESACIRRQTKGFTKEELLQAIEYYYTSKHIDKSKNINNDLTIITSKNIHILIKTYCKEHNLEPSDPFTILNMKKDGYMFSQVGHLEETLQELEINMFPDRFTDIAQDYDHPTSYYDMVERTATHNRLKRQAAIMRNKLTQAGITNFCCDAIH